MCNCKHVPSHINVYIVDKKTAFTILHNFSSLVALLYKYVCIYIHINIIDNCFVYILTDNYIF